MSKLKHSTSLDFGPPHPQPLEKCPNISRKEVPPQVWIGRRPRPLLTVFEKIKIFFGDGFPKRVAQYCWTRGGDYFQLAVKIISFTCVINLGLPICLKNADNLGDKLCNISPAH